MKRPLGARPMPTARAVLPVSFRCSAAQFERLRLGHAMTDMNDPWYVFHEEPWVYVVHTHGTWAYGMRFERDAGAYRCAEAWVTREPEGLDWFGYKLAWDDLEGNALYLQVLLRWLVTGKVPLELHEKLEARRRVARPGTKA